MFEKSCFVNALCATVCLCVGEKWVIGRMYLHVCVSVVVCGCIRGNCVVFFGCVCVFVCGSFFIYFVEVSIVLVSLGVYQLFDFLCLCFGMVIVVFVVVNQHGCSCV